jgi:TRAP transporter TAXI family solute receptor
MLVAASVLAWLAGAAAASAQTYGLGTMSPGTLSYSTASAIAKMMQQRLDLQTRLQPNAGESTLLPLVNNGEFDLGIANVLEVANAYAGEAVAGKQQALRVVGVIHPLRVGFFVRKDSGIKTLADLKGKRVTIGFSAMRTINSLALAALASAGLGEKDVKPVLVPNVIRSADDFMNGSADCFFFALGAGKVNEVDASVGGIVLLPIDDSPSAMAAVTKLFSYGYATEVTPRPGLTGVPVPTKVLTYDNLLVTNAAAKDEFVYKVVDGLVKYKAELVETAPWLRELEAEALYKKFPIPYHPGALKWFQEKKIEAKG